MKYEHLFFDLDHTIWDFEKNSFEAFARMFDVMRLESALGIHFHVFHAQYMVHNQYYWDLYAKGLIPQSDLKWKRMYETLKSFGLEDEFKSKDMSHVYLEYLPTCTNLFPHTKQVLQYLKDKGYQMHILSNGFEITQHSKLKNSALDGFFKNIVTSERCGYIKPDAQIFKTAMNEAGTFVDKCIMIGDSPEADLKGALNAGMDSVYVDHTGKDTEVLYTYRVGGLKGLMDIL